MLTGTSVIPTSYGRSSLLEIETWKFDVISDDIMFIHNLVKISSLFQMLKG
jgi:hypothetical protein